MLRACINVHTAAYISFKIIKLDDQYWNFPIDVNWIDNVRGYNL